MVGVMLLFGGQQVQQTYLRPLLEVVGGFDANGVALVLLVLGTASLLGTLVAPVFLRRGLRQTLTGVAATQAVLLALLFVLGQGSTILMLILVAGWGFAVGMVAVGWSTWLAQTYPDHAESGGILVAVIQGSMMLGAMVGGVLIDTVGVTGPLLTAAAVLAIGAVHTFNVLRSRIR